MGSSQSLTPYISLFMVAIGGALGAVSRYVVSGWIHQQFPSSFPWGTLTINSVGSFLFGVVAMVLSKYFSDSDLVRLVLMTGFLGAFTTFSTFSYESIWLIQQGKLFLAGLNIIGSVVVCCTAAGIGLWIGQRI